MFLLLVPFSSHSTQTPLSHTPFRKVRQRKKTERITLHSFLSLSLSFCPSIFPSSESGCI